MSHDPNRMSTRRGGGCLILFGLPFLAAGLGIIVAAVVGVATTEGESATPLFFVVPFGLIFAAVGAGIMFGRAGLDIDLSARTITTWWGLLVPFRSKTYPIDKARFVTIAREVRRSKNSTYTVYPVRISGLEKPVNVQEPRDYNSARRRAEEIAKFMGLGVEDATSGKKVVREAGTLDESLRDRARRTGEGREMPETPAGVKSKVTVSGSEATFEIPPAGFGAAEVVTLVLGVGVLVGLSIGAAFLFGEGGPFRSGDGDGEYVGLAVGAFFGLFGLGVGGGLIAQAVKSGLGREFVTVSPQALAQRMRSPFGAKTREIPASELEEIEVGGSASGLHTEVVIARSDAVTLEIGRGLDKRELAWISDVVKFITTA